MVVIAVAGGTGGIGRTIVDELLQQGKHEVLILSRKTSNVPDLQNVPILEADYSKTLSVKKTLQDHNVQVVISALSLFDEESAQSQLNLINAAIDSGSVTRFIPSEFGVNYSLPDLVKHHPAAKWFNDAADALRSSQLGFTRVIFGQLTDFYGYPHRKSHMKQFTYFVDFENRKAALPGDGKNTATFLHSVDLAKYTVALLDEATWPEISAFASDRMTWNELVEVAERVTGEKWAVTYDTVDQLEKGQSTYLEQPTGPGSYNMPEEFGRVMTTEFGNMAAQGFIDVSPAGIRNGDFPLVKPITVEEIITEAWGKAR